MFSRMEAPGLIILFFLVIVCFDNKYQVGIWKENVYVFLVQITEIKKNRSNKVLILLEF